MSYRFIHKGIEYEIDENSQSEVDREIIRLNERKLDYERLVYSFKAVIAITALFIGLSFIFIGVQVIGHVAGWAFFLAPLFAPAGFIEVVAPWLPVVLAAIIFLGLLLYIFRIEYNKIEDLIDLELSNIGKE